jgi:hypothetical protein
MPTPPDLAAVKLYLRIAVDDVDPVRDAEIAGALATEIAAQKKAVRVSAFGTDPEPPADPVAYPVDLAEAVGRRVARNLALRGLPLAVLQSDAEGGALVTPGKDPEVRRLEGPYRRLPSG